jgi:hypothetical protein
MNKLNRMLEGDIERTSDEVVKQSQKVDRLILEYMRECGDMSWMKEKNK